jgi:hypothetical protein
VRSVYLSFCKREFSIHRLNKNAEESPMNIGFERRSHLLVFGMFPLVAELCFSHYLSSRNTYLHSSDWLQICYLTLMRRSVCAFNYISEIGAYNLYPIDFAPATVEWSKNSRRSSRTCMNPSRKDAISSSRCILLALKNLRTIYRNTEDNLIVCRLRIVKWNNKYANQWKHCWK